MRDTPRRPAHTPTGSPQHCFEHDGERLTVDLGAHGAMVNGKDIKLTQTEFQVLTLLAENAGRAVSHGDIHRAIWGGWYGSAGHIAVHIHRIRRALGTCSEMIVTRRSVGYMLDALPTMNALPIEEESSSVAPVTLAFLDDLQKDAARREVVWYVSDRARTICWVSATITALAGWDVDEVVGRLPCSFIHEDEREAFQELFPLHGGDREVHHQNRFLRADGTAVLADFSGRVFTDSDGNRVMGVREVKFH